MTHGIMVLGALAVYEGLVLVLFNGWRRRHRASPWSFRYLNTLVEVSLPTLILVLIGAQIGTTQALLGAAPFLWFILVFLSALHLDFWFVCLRDLWLARNSCNCPFWGPNGGSGCRVEYPHLVRHASDQVRNPGDGEPGSGLRGGTGEATNAGRHPAEDLGEVLLKGQVGPTCLFRLA